MSGLWGGLSQAYRWKNQSERGISWRSRIIRSNGVNMKKFKEYPEAGELVVIEIGNVNPHSVFAKLEGYEKEGMIHISEISRSWVRDIKKHVKEGEKNVAQVLEVDKEKDQLSLSLKRVNDKQKREKMDEWKKEQKADKLLEKVSEKTEIDKEELYEKIAFPFQKNFENTFDGFQKSLTNGEDIKELIGNEMFQKVNEVASENISLKNVEMESVMRIEVPKPNGIEIIKKALKTGEGIEISYLSAPKYKIKTWGINNSECKKRMKNTIEEIRGRIEESEGGFSVEKA